jgi:hypothetical protein
MRPLPENAMELYASESQTQTEASTPAQGATIAVNPASPVVINSIAKSATLSGTIVKDRANFVLRDSGGNIYQLDDSAMAEPFAGKPVKVTGTLQESARLIHVQAIQGARA